MKTTHTISLTLAAVSAFFLLSSFLTQQSETKYLTVKSIEFYSSMFDSKITIVDESGKVEEFDLFKLRAKNMGENAKKVNDIFNDLSKKGYSLKNSTTASWGQDGFISTYIFEKK